MYISGNSNNDLVDTNGAPLRATPADILMHEMVGHAIPVATKWDTGNAVDNKNKARAEISNAGQHAPEMFHLESF